MKVVPARGNLRPIYAFCAIAATPAELPRPEADGDELEALRAASNTQPAKTKVLCSREEVAIV